MRVVVGIDGSTHSFQALDCVARWLHPARDEVLIYCTPPNIAPPSLATAPEVIERARGAVLEAILSEAKRHLPASFHAKMRTFSSDRPPQEAILDLAKSESADLITIGARGVGAIERMLIGSVSHSIAQHAKIPVLIVHQPVKETPTVLVAMDDSAASKRAAEFVGRFNWPHGTRGAFVSVREPAFNEMPDWLKEKKRPPEVEELCHAWVEHEATVKRNAEASLKQLGSSLPEPFNTFDAVVIEGAAGARLMEYAAERATDVIVLGATNKSGLQQFLLGSVSAKLLQEGSFNVLIYH